jgi:hypothetical protein
VRRWSNSFLSKLSGRGFESLERHRLSPTKLRHLIPRMRQFVRAAASSAPTL